MSEEVHKFITFEKLSDALLWLYIVAIAAIYRFFKWFFVREYNGFMQKIQNETKNELNAINQKLTILDGALKNYKDKKHSTDNENAALTSSMQICKETLELSERVYKESIEILKARKERSQ
jgi:F0F1-type ATP synthase membrane subunit b/b'